MKSSHSIKNIIILSSVFTFIISSLMVIVPCANSQDLKIGYINQTAILSRMPETAAVQQRIQNLYERKQNELTEKEQELQTEIGLYQQKAGVISEQARRTEEQRLTNLDMEFRQLQTDAQQELQQERIKLLSPLLKRIQTSVDNVASEMELDLVINTTISGYGVLDRNVIYVAPELQTRYNITSPVLEDLDIY